MIFAIVREDFICDKLKNWIQTTFQLSIVHAIAIFSVSLLALTLQNSAQFNLLTWHIQYIQRIFFFAYDLFPSIKICFYIMKSTVGIISGELLGVRISYLLRIHTPRKSIKKLRIRFEGIIVETWLILIRSWPPEHASYFCWTILIDCDPKQIVSVYIIYWFYKEIIQFHLLLYLFFHYVKH
jgi:hypothetical protein